MSSSTRLTAHGDKAWTASAVLHPAAKAGSASGGKAPEAAKPPASRGGSGGGPPPGTTGSSTRLAKSNPRWPSAASATSVRSSAKSSTASSSYLSDSLRTAAASTPSRPPAMSSSARSSKPSWFPSSQARIRRSAGVAPPAPLALPPWPGVGACVVFRGMLLGAFRCGPPVGSGGGRRKPQAPPASRRQTADLWNKGEAETPHGPVLYSARMPRHGSPRANRHGRPKLSG